MATFWRSCRARWGRLTAAAVLLAVLAGTIAQDAAPVVEAHATLIRSVPENGSQERRPPARVILYFSEPVEPKLTNIEVFDVDRNRVDEEDVAVDSSDPKIASVGVPTLDPGLYTVEFSNVSTVDGHPWSGIFQFIILNPDGSVPEDAVFDPDAGTAGGTGLLPQNIDIILKFASILSLAITIGAASFVLLVARPASRFLEDEDQSAVERSSESWIVTLAHVLLPVAFIAAALLVVVSVNRFQTSVGLFEYLTSVRTGRYQLANLILLVVALAAADVIYLSARQRLKDAGLVAMIAAGLGSILTYSLTSHGATGAGKFWTISADFTHFVAASIWLGALVLLVPLLRFRRQHFGDASTGFLYLANAFDRFSVVAGASVFVVLVTGVFSALAAIPSWGAMTDTTYGKVLLSKLFLVGLVLPVAGLNAFILKPRLVASIDLLHQEGGTSDTDRRAGATRSMDQLKRWLPRTVIAEVLLVVAVFASVSVLTQTSTAEGEIAQRKAEQAASTEFLDVRQAGDLELTFEVQPNRVGINRYTLTVRDASGLPPATVTLARLRFSYTDPTQPDVRPPSAELQLRETTTPGQYQGQGSYFTQPGSWLVEATIRRSDADDVSRTFSVPVAVSERTGADEGGAFALPFDSLQWNHVAGALLALLGILIVLYREQVRPLARHAYRIGLTAGTAFILAGATLWFGVHTHEARPDPSAGNPIEASEESIARGRMLFQQNCIVCHGPEGRGDGPQAESLNPAPADIRQHLPYHTDPQFFNFVAQGIAGTAMPAWGSNNDGPLSDDDIWNVINYMRTFQDVDQE
jgi:copper transport protein